MDGPYDNLIIVMELSRHGIVSSKLKSTSVDDLIKLADKKPHNGKNL